jgi:hypothetical protein
MDLETRKRVIRENLDHYLKNAFTKPNPLPIYLSTNPKSKHFHGSNYKISLDELETITREILKPMDTQTHRFIVDQEPRNYGFLELQLVITVMER